MDVTHLSAAEILDSRGYPTVEVTLRTGPIEVRASVPSGKSTGQFEALELRDKNGARYGGKGVLHAVASVNEGIAPELVGKALPAQPELDGRLCDLDGTPNKQRLGANAILGVSIAAARARAAEEAIPLYRSLGGEDANLLPVPCLNVINGGAHAPNELDFQEFMIVPAGRPTFAEALRAGAETYHALAALLEEAGLSSAVGDEGGFAPAVSEPTEALDWLLRATEKAGYRPGEDVFLALDPAASGFYGDGRYHFSGHAYDAAEMTDLYRGWLERYPILSIEDGLAEDDHDGWVYLTREIGDRVQLVGDDVFVSDPERVREGIREREGNAVLLKPNQIGTVTEITETAAVARDSGWHAMMSHRSGETDDPFVADLAVALRTGQIKAGAPARGERVAKYNQLLRIERELGPRARFPGRSAFGASD
jgi:enolase